MVAWFIGFVVVIRHLALPLTLFSGGLRQWRRQRPPKNHLTTGSAGAQSLVLPDLTVSHTAGISQHLKSMSSQMECFGAFVSGR